MPSPTSTRDYLKAEERQLGEMYLVSRQEYSIPFNQRPWSWEKKQVIRLWEDFIKTLEGGYDRTSSPMWRERDSFTSPPHFFGAFIFLMPQGVSNCEIFDGQQRITAISMLVACLRDLVIEVVLKGNDQEKLRANQVSASLSQWLQADPSSPNSRRIIPDHAFDGLFSALIGCTEGDEKRKMDIKGLALDFSIHKDHKRLHDGFYQFKALVSKETEGLSRNQMIDFVKASERTIGTRFLCISSILYKENFAYQVFRSLNDTGLKLTQADNIKNSLFTNAKISDHQVISSLWRETIEALPSQDIGEFLRRRFIGIYGPCKKDELSSKVLAKEIEPMGETIQPLLNLWKADAKIVNNLTRGSTPISHANPTLKAAFSSLSISLASIPLLPAYKRWATNSPKDFTRFARLITNFCFRELSICQQKTNWLEEKLGIIGRLVTDSKSFAEIQKMLRTLSPDAKFEKDFIDAAETRSSVQFYVLKEIESYLSKGAGMIPLDHSPKQHIEHILPRNLSNSKNRKHEWQWARSVPKRHLNFVNRYGNLLILEANINKSVSNFEFAVKQTGSYKGRTIPNYGSSSLKLAKSLSRQNRWKEWSFSHIQRRQKLLARLARRVWAL